jgi:hypothetical protein
MSADPMDLRSLGEVDSPEVVSAALARFRRRIWTRYLWALAIVAAVAVVSLQAFQPDDLRQRIERADGSLTNGVYVAGDARIGVDRVDDLGDTVGLHLVTLPAAKATFGSAPTGPQLRIDGSVTSERTGAFDRWVEIDPPADGVVHVRALGPGCPGQGCRIDIDLGALGVPDSTWR